MKKYPPSPKKATAQTVASNNIIAYGIFRFHEGMSICRFHELSHAYATHSYENGLDLLSLKSRLGHRSLNSTAIYVHLASSTSNTVTNPFDQLGGTFYA